MKTQKSTIDLDGGLKEDALCIGVVCEDVGPGSDYFSTHD